ncbi:MAG TPA: hypothetical protein PKE69_01175 [Pyrinomonadaceae bacterium]|nr:hypothetical protein [Pyrinomonadaceae bacterium]
MNVTVEIHENLYRNVAALAQKSNRKVDEIIIDKLEEDFSVEEIEFGQNIAVWTDEEVLALANLKIPEAQATRIDELSERRELGVMTNLEQNELEIYLKSVQIATLRKADGIVEAVRRNLISSPKDLT